MESDLKGHVGDVMEPEILHLKNSFGQDEEVGGWVEPCLRYLIQLTPL